MDKKKNEFKKSHATVYLINLYFILQVETGEPEPEPSDLATQLERQITIKVRLQSKYKHKMKTQIFHKSLVPVFEITL